jgi:hypothetical protein
VDFAHDSANARRSSNETTPRSHRYRLHTQPIVSFLKSTALKHMNSHRP